MLRFLVVTAVGLFILTPFLVEADPISDKYLWYNWSELTPSAQTAWVEIVTKPGWDVVWLEWTRAGTHTLIIFYLHNNLTQDRAIAIANYGVPIRESNLWKLIWRISDISGRWNWAPSEDLIGYPFTSGL